MNCEDGQIIPGSAKVTPSSSTPWTTMLIVIGLVLLLGDIALRALWGPPV